MMWVKIAQITMFMLAIFLILGVPAHFVRCRATPGSAIAPAPCRPLNACFRLQANSQGGRLRRLAYPLRRRTKGHI